MAVLGAVLTDDVLFGAGTPPALSTDLDSAPVINLQGAFDLGDDNLLGAGGAYRVPGITEVRNFGGVEASTYFDDFYFRIHFNPRALKFGNITIAESKTFRIWNSFLIDKTVSEFSVAGGQGVIFSPPTTPFILHKTEEASFEFSVDPNFNRPINTDITITIAGITYYVKVTGTIVSPLIPRPNLKSDIIENLEWKTFLNQFKDGTEQAASLRDNRARRSIEYDFALIGVEAIKFENLLFGWQNKLFSIPLWPYQERLSASADAGDTEVYFSTNYLGFSVGSSIILDDEKGVTELCVITGVFSNKLTLEEPLQNDWPVNSFVAPVMYSVIDGGVPMVRVTPSLVQGSVKFLGLTDPVNEVFLPSVSASITHDDIEVYLVEPEWSKPVDFERSFEYLTVDSGFGKVTNFSRQKAQTTLRAFRWVLNGRDKIYNFRGFLARRKGRAIPVYLPSWSYDFELLSPIGNSDTVILTRNLGYGRYVQNNPNRNLLAFKLSTGAYLIRQIMVVIDSEEGTEITIDAALGADSDKVVEIYSVILCRLDSDSIDLRFINGLGDLCVVEADFMSKVI